MGYCTMASSFLHVAMWLLALLTVHPGALTAAQYFQNFEKIRLTDPKTNTMYDGYK